MAFGEEIASWTNRVEAKAARLEGLTIDAAYDELAERLAERLPEVAPIDSGALARSYTFRIEDGQLIVGNDAFYAAAIARFGGRHDLAETIGREADAIVNGAAFIKAIEARVYGQL